MLDHQSKDYRRRAIRLMKSHGGTHFGGTFSCAEILIQLYKRILVPDDVFILSKGHSCWIYYLLLREEGFNPRIENHPRRDPSNGIHFTTGSMGHGFPAALGFALGKKMENKSGRVFVLLGDGECQEGTTWESLLLAAKLKLSNLIVIIDSNKVQATGFVEDVLPVMPSVISAATAAGWRILQIDGHSNDLSEILWNEVSSPLLIIANTVKGKGISFMEGKSEWHSRWLDDEKETLAMNELL